MHFSLMGLFCKRKSWGEAVLKACLVAYRFDEGSMNTFEKKYPTTSKDNVKTLLSIIFSNNQKLKSIDIETGFLQRKK